MDILCHIVYCICSSVVTPVCYIFEKSNKWRDFAQLCTYLSHMVVLHVTFTMPHLDYHQCYYCNSTGCLLRARVTWCTMLTAGLLHCTCLTSSINYNGSYVIPRIQRSLADHEFKGAVPSKCYHLPSSVIHCQSYSWAVFAIYCTTDDS